MLTKLNAKLNFRSVNISYENLSTEFDNIHVFDLLSGHERTSWRISDEIESCFATMPGFVEVHFLSEKLELFDALGHLLMEVKSGKRFIFHFVSHGKDDCIGFKHSGEKIGWDELCSILEAINIAAENTLVLNMSSCLGLHGIKIVDNLTKGSPFFGLIGYSDSIGFDQAIDFNKRFYNYLQQGYQINDAIRMIQNDTNDPKYLCISSQGYNALRKLDGKG